MSFKIKICSGYLLLHFKPSQTLMAYNNNNFISSYDFLGKKFGEGWAELLISMLWLRSHGDTHWWMGWAGGRKVLYLQDCLLGGRAGRLCPVVELLVSPVWLSLSDFLLGSSGLWRTSQETGSESSQSLKAWVGDCSTVFYCSERLQNQPRFKRKGHRHPLPPFQWVSGNLTILNLQQTL